MGAQAWAHEYVGQSGWVDQFAVADEHFSGREDLVGAGWGEGELGCAGVAAVLCPFGFSFLGAGLGFSGDGNGGVCERGGR